MHLVCTGIHKKEERQIWARIYELGGQVMMTRADEKFPEKVDAVIVDKLNCTDKLVLAIASGIPILDITYITTCHQLKEWVPFEPFDLGGPRFQKKREEVKIHIPDLEYRRRIKEHGGVFRGWKVVLLIENSIQRTKLSQQIQIGGGECIRWTVRHLVDATKADIARLTKILTEPIFLNHPDFITFLETKKDWNIPDVIGYNYLSNYLTRFPRFSIHKYSIFNEEIIRHLCVIQQISEEVTDELVEKGKQLQERKNPRLPPEQISPIRSNLNRSFDSDSEFGPGSSFSPRSPRIIRKPSSSGLGLGLSTSIRRLPSQPRHRRQTGDKVQMEINETAPFGLVRVEPRPSETHASDHEKSIDSPDFERLANYNTSTKATNDSSHSNAINDVSHSNAINDVSHSNVINGASHSNAINDASHSNAINDASHSNAINDEPFAYAIDDNLSDNATEDIPDQEDSDSDIQILDDDIVEVVEDNNARANVDNNAVSAAGGEVVVDNDEIQIIDDECQIIEPEKSKEQVRRRKRKWKTGNKELDRQRYLEHLWWGPRVERPPNYLTEPYEAVTDLFFDPDHPIFCDRNLAVKYYKNELIAAYKELHKKT